MTEAFNLQPEPESPAQPKQELALVAGGMTEFELRLSHALSAGSDWVIDYRVASGEPPRRYLRAEAIARYVGRPALRTIE